MLTHTSDKFPARMSLGQGGSLKMKKQKEEI